MAGISPMSYAVPSVTSSARPLAWAFLIAAPLNQARTVDAPTPVSAAIAVAGRVRSLRSSVSRVRTPFIGPLPR
ncbi:hypothetical protein GCM10027418_17030 [Mariniluteicoccus endophyticus]